MAPKDLPWFRFYSEARRDPKIRKAAQAAGVSFLEAFGFWTAILTLAGESPDRGKLLVTLQERFCIDDVAFECNTDVTTAEKLLAAFVKYGMIEMPEDAPIEVINWNKRQFSSDNSTPRVQKFRKKPECNVSVTAPDTDTESDTDIEESAPQNPEIALYREVTGLVPDYSREEEVKRNIQEIRRKYKSPPRDVLLQMLCEKYELWKGQHTADGKPYNPSNPKWLEWVITNYTPLNGKAEQPKKRRGVPSDY